MLRSQIINTEHYRKNIKFGLAGEDDLRFLKCFLGKLSEEGITLHCQTSGGDRLMNSTVILNRDVVRKFTTTDLYK